MEPRPHLKIELSLPDKILEITGWVFLIFLWVLVIMIYASLPANIPTHFNASGKVDSYGSKMTFFILPILGTAIFTGLTILNKYPWIYNYISYAREHALIQYTYATKMIRSLKTAIIVVFLLIDTLTWLTAAGKINGLGWWFLPFALVLFLLPTLFYIVKSFKEIKKADSL